MNIGLTTSSNIYQFSIKRNNILYRIINKNYWYFMARAIIFNILDIVIIARHCGVATSQQLIHVCNRINNLIDRNPRINNVWISE